MSGIYDVTKAEILEGYLGAALYLESDPDTEASLADAYSPADFTPEARASASADIEAFLAMSLPADFRLAVEQLGASRFGSDLWYDRSGADAGLFDEHLGDAGKRLSASAQLLGAVHVFQDGHGKVYFA